ncbi:hypothetical protein HK102_007231 [Quaeritorhiza haematococci]|nr:hypothetical protein HK102_007231 [Quaeritorhiza haematococci]
MSNPWHQLPNELLFEILVHMDYEVLQWLCRTDKFMRDVCKNGSMDIYFNKIKREFGLSTWKAILERVDSLMPLPEHKNPAQRLRHAGLDAEKVYLILVWLKTWPHFEHEFSLALQQDPKSQSDLYYQAIGLEQFGLVSSKTREKQRRQIRILIKLRNLIPMDAFFEDRRITGIHLYAHLLDFALPALSAEELARICTIVVVRMKKALADPRQLKQFLELLWRLGQ